MDKFSLSEFRFFRPLLSRLEHIRRNFREADNKISIKSDDSPVTLLDKMFNDEIVQTLKRECPDDSILSEESDVGNSRGYNKRIWIVDPLDGTKEFILGSNEWAVQIGLVEANQVTFGLVAALAADAVFVAKKGKGAFRTNIECGGFSQIQVRDQIGVKGLTLLASKSHKDSRTEDFAKTWGFTEIKQMGSLGCKLSTIAEGSADAYFIAAGRCSLWDICAPEIIVKEAGGYAGYFDGSSVNYQDHSSTKIQQNYLASTNLFWETFRAKTNSGESSGI